MQLEKLKKGMFGYTMQSVLRYISTMEEEFSAKLAERDVQSKKDTENYTRRIQELEETLASLKKEYEAQQARELIIADTLLEAQSHAAQMKVETERQELKLRQQLEQEAARYQAELNHYATQLQKFREHFHTLMSEIDQTVETVEEEISKVSEQAPASNMSLFERKPQHVQD